MECDFVLIAKRKTNERQVSGYLRQEGEVMMIRKWIFIGRRA